MLKLKEKILLFFSKRLTKKNRVQRMNVGFSQATTLGILYTYENAAKQQEVVKFAKQIKKTGKKLKVLCYLLEKNTNEGDPFSTFTHQTIQIFGKIIDPTVNAFVNTPFDYLYCMDDTPPIVLDYLLAKCQAKCRIGPFNAHKTHLFDMMIKLNTPEQQRDIGYLTEQMWHYTQLLKAK